MSIMIYHLISHQAYKGTSKKIWMICTWNYVVSKKKNRQIKFMKYSGIEGECPALALGLWHTSPHPQFSLSYCGHILKKTHQPRDIRLKILLWKLEVQCLVAKRCDVILQWWETTEIHCNLYIGSCLDLSIGNWILCSGMLLYLHHRNSKLFFHTAKFDNFKDEKISDFKTVSVSQSKNLLDWKLVV